MNTFNALSQEDNDLLIQAEMEWQSSAQEDFDDQLLVAAEIAYQKERREDMLLVEAELAFNSMQANNQQCAYELICSNEPTCIEVPDNTISPVESNNDQSTSQTTDEEFFTLLMIYSFIFLFFNHYVSQGYFE